MTPKEKVKNLIGQMWYGGINAPYRKKSKDHAISCSLLCIDKQLELLRYLGSKTTEELYNDLVEQKKALKDF